MVVQPVGMVMICPTPSVSAEPLPLSHASQVPECGGSPDVEFVIGLFPSVDDSIQPVVPLSNPGLVSSCVGVQPQPAGLTVTAYVVVWVPEAAVPVTVMVNVPVAVEPVVATVSVELPPAVTDAGVSVTVDPAGPPVADSVTVCALPDVTAVEMVVLTEPPWVTEPDAGLAEIEKSLAGAVAVAGFHQSPAITM